MESTVEVSPLPQSITPNDFVFQEMIGNGSFGAIFLAKNLQNNQQYAIKVLKEEEDDESNKIAKFSDVEKDALTILSGSTKCVQMYGTMRHINDIFFVLEYIGNGDLFSYLQNEDCISLGDAKYHAAEILLGLEEMHSKGIVHRDIKPENIMFDENFHIRIIDFGLAKIINHHKNETEADDETPTNNFIGSSYYMSPEAVRRSKILFASDLWAYGCIVYQMVCGFRLFDTPSPFATFELILHLEYDFPTDFDPSAKDLVQKLLVLEPELRLGASDSSPYQSIRNHEFFSDIDWNNMGEPPTITPIDSERKVIYCNTEPGFDDKIVEKLYKEKESKENRENRRFYEEEEEDYSSFNY